MTTIVQFLVCPILNMLHKSRLCILKKAIQKWERTITSGTVLTTQIHKHTTKVFKILSNMQTVDWIHCLSKYKTKCIQQNHMVQDSELSKKVVHHRVLSEIEALLREQFSILYSLHGKELLASDHFLQYWFTCLALLCHMM